MADNAKGGITTKKKVPEPKVIMPYDPENINLTKKEFVAKQKKALERQLKLKEYEEKLLAEEGAVDSESLPKEKPAVEEKEKPTIKRGRPRKIE